MKYPHDLPISGKIDEIARLIDAHQVVVVAGETGSGKSTQLPKLCLSRCQKHRGMIAHTQPRRIAAREIASRVSAELGTHLGDLVGYKIRFRERSGANTKIKVLTDGMLLAELEQDRTLRRYHTIIVDEAHERSINIDFILGYLKRLLKKRPELRVVITSATIDTERFSKHFGNCPIVEVSGRTYPVELIYQEPDNTGEADALLTGVERAVRELWRHGPGDVLVFLPGEREIRETRRFLERRIGDGVEILPMYARLSPPEQKRIFTVARGRRVVLSTNVAETSLTVPGIRYVVDSGLARISRYSAARKVQRLPIEKISRAAADQRKGRCGRVQSGVCVRLFTEQDYESRSRFTDPEIGRTSLAAVILKMKALGLGEVDRFPFIDPPDQKQVRSGLRLLREIGALDDSFRLTTTGKRLARLPVDPRLGRLLLEGVIRSCVSEMLVIAARLSVQDPQVFPQDQIDQARGHHRKFPEAGTDIEVILELWREYGEQSAVLSRRKLTRWCEVNFLSPFRMREWQELHNQLSGLMNDANYRKNDQSADTSSVARALLSGFLGNIACMGERGEFQGSHGKSISVHPSSRSFKKFPKWLVAAELVDSGRLYARQVLPVRVEWIEQIAENLVRYNYAEPWWDRRSGNVMVWQSGWLFGLPLFSRRRKPYARVDETASRTIFISEALVVAEMGEDFEFARKNRALLQEADAIRQKLRIGHDLADDETIFNFFDRQLPEKINSRPTLMKWVKESPSRAGTLVLPRDIVIENELAGQQLAYPDRISISGTELDVDYRYMPGSEQDGATLRIPLPVLNQLDLDAGARNIPGWHEKRVEALIRSLPKAKRRPLVPIPDQARRLAGELAKSGGDTVDALIVLLGRDYNLKVRSTDFCLERVPDNLKLRIELVNESGEVIDSGRDLEALRSRHRASVADAFERSASGDVQQRGIKRWDFGDLEQRVPMEGYGSRLYAFTALIDRGNHVDLELLDNPEEARKQHRGGLRRLIGLHYRGLLKELGKNNGMKQLAVRYAGLYPGIDLSRDFSDAVVDAALGGGDVSIFQQGVFESILRESKSMLIETATRIGRDLPLVLDAAYLLRKNLANLSDSQFRDSLTAHADSLIGPGFLLITPVARVRDLARYLKAISARYERQTRNPETDVNNMAKLSVHIQRRVSASDVPGINRVALDDYRWMVEEYFVSIFAQQLGTSMPVSAKRLDRNWEELTGGG